MSKISAAFGRLQNQRGGSRARKFREEDQAFRNANQTAESIQTGEIADSISSLPVAELNESMVGTTADESNKVQVVDDQGSPTSTRPGANVPSGPANLNELDVNVIGANQNAIDQIKDMGGIPTDEDIFPPQEGREIKDPATYSNLPLPDTITDEQRARGDRSIKDSIEETLQEGFSDKAIIPDDQAAINFGQRVNQNLIQNYKREVIDAEGNAKFDLGALLNAGAKSFQATGDKFDLFGAEINMENIEESVPDVEADAQSFIKKYAGNFLGSIVSKDKLNMSSDPSNPLATIRPEFGRAAMLATILELGNRIAQQDFESDKVENDRRFDDALDRINIGKAVARRIERLLYPSATDTAKSLFENESRGFGYKSRLTDSEQSILGQMIVQGFADSPFVDFFQSRLITSKDGKQKMSFVSTRQGDLQLPLIRRAIMQELGMQGHDRPVSLVPLVEGRLKGEAAYTQKEITTQLKPNKKTRKIIDAIDQLSRVAHTTSEHKNDLYEGILINAKMNMNGFFAKVAKQDREYLKKKNDELYAGYMAKKDSEGLLPQDINPNYANFEDAAINEAKRIQESHYQQRFEQLKDSMGREGVPFYYGYTVINNSSRLMITNTELNYQSDKVARFLVDGAKPVIFKKGGPKEKAFMLLVARSVVKGADKFKTEAELLNAFNKDKNKYLKLGKEIRDYTTFKRQMNNSSPQQQEQFRKTDKGFEASSELQEYLASIGKDGFYFSLDALHELSKYDTTPSGQQFATRLKGEMDGNANGAVIQAMQMGIVEILRRGGILYKDPATYTNEEAEELVEDIRIGVFEIMEQMDKTSKDMKLTDVLSSIRAEGLIKDLLKEPIMTTIYGKDSQFHFLHVKKFISDNEAIFKDVIEREGSIDKAAVILSDYVKDGLNVGLGGALEHAKMMKRMGRAFNFANKIAEIEGANGYMVQAGGFEYLEDSQIRLKFGKGLSELSPNVEGGTPRQNTIISTFKRETSAQSKAGAKRIESGRKNDPKIGSKLRNQLAVNGTQNIDATVAQNTVTRVGRMNPDGLVMQVYDAFMGDVNTYSQLLKVSNEEFKAVNKEYNMILKEQEAFNNLLVEMKREFKNKRDSNQTYDIGTQGTHRSMTDFLVNYATIIKNEVDYDDAKQALTAATSLDGKLFMSGFNKNNPPDHLFVSVDTFEFLFDKAIEALNIKKDLSKMVTETQARKKAIEKEIADILSRQYS